MVVVRAKHCRNRRVLQRNKADNNTDPGDRLNAWPPLRELQNGQGKAPITGRIYECNRTDDRVGKSFAHCLWGESIYALLDGASTLQVLAKCDAGDEADEKYYACALNITLVFWQKLG